MATVAPTAHAPLAPPLPLSLPPAAPLAFGSGTADPNLASLFAALPVWAQFLFYVVTAALAVAGAIVAVRSARSVAVRDANREAASYREEAARHQKDTVDALDALNQRLTVEVDRLSDDIQTIREESVRKDATIAELQGKVTRLEAEVATLRRNLSSKEAELEAVKAHRDQIQSERNDFKARLIHAEAELAQARADLSRAKALIVIDQSPQATPDVKVVLP